MATLQTLNVTLLEPRLKHPTVFQYFDALSAGENFVIENDHTRNHCITSFLPSVETFLPGNIWKKVRNGSLFRLQKIQQRNVRIYKR